MTDAVTGEMNGPSCCKKCERATWSDPPKLWDMMNRRFIVCSICGNKRCPKATDHDLGCTNSNASGQKGSIYE